VTLIEAIRKRNYPLYAPLRGARISRIQGPTRGEVTALIMLSFWQLAKLMPVPKEEQNRDALCYLSSVINQESRFDPRAFNRNFTLLEAVRGRSDDPGKGDYGAAMFKLRFVRTAADMPECHGLSDDAILEGFLFNAEWAIPKMAERYLYRLSLARQEFPHEDPRRVATGMYKAGIRGYRERINWSATMTHMDRVMQHHAWFQANLDKEA